MRLYPWIVAALLTSGCSTINSVGGGNVSHTDDVWFVRSTSLFGLQLSSSVWYCPAPTRPGPTPCIEAVIDGPVPASARNADVAPEGRPSQESPDAASTPEGSASPVLELTPSAAPPAAPGVIPLSRSATSPPTRRPTASTCHGLALPDTARVVTDATARGALPEANGGEIRDGLYVLVRSEIHRPFANLFERRMVLRIRSGAFDAVAVRGPEALQATRGMIRVMPGGRIMFQVECPATGQMEFDHFTSTDDGLVLYDEETQRVISLAREEIAPPSAAETAAPPTSETPPVSASEQPTPTSPEGVAHPTARPSRHRGARRR